jgi:IS30 family transposase
LCAENLNDPGPPGTGTLAVILCGKRQSQARGVLKKELMDHLRSNRRMRHATVSGQSRGQIVDAISIRERPAEVEDRAVPGHWEGDRNKALEGLYGEVRKT